MNLNRLFDEINEILVFCTVGWFKGILERRRNNKRFEKIKAREAIEDPEEYKIYTEIWNITHKDNK